MTPMEQEQKWLEERRSGIGGSDIAAILGISRHRTPLDIFLSKTITMPSVDNKFMRAGRRLEGAVIDYYAEESGKQVVPFRKVMETAAAIRGGEPELVLRSSQNPQWIASLDACIYEKQITDPLLFDAVFEAKTTQRTMTQPSPEWYAQLQWYLLVTERKWGTIGWLERGLEFRYETVSADTLLHEKMKEAAMRFWNDHVLEGIAPEPMNEEDVKRLFPTPAAGKQIIASTEIQGAVTRLSKIKEDISSLEDQADAETQRIKAFMADAELLVDADEATLAMWKQSAAGKQFDAKAFRAENPELAEKYMKVVEGTRRFVVK